MTGLCVVARAPRPPAWLLPEARAFWRRVARQLLRAGVLHPELDRWWLAMLATVWALWRRAAAEAAATPDPARAAALRELAREQAGLWLQLAGEGGLTPAARADLRRAVGSGADPAGALLRGWQTGHPEDRP